MERIELSLQKLNIRINLIVIFVLLLFSQNAIAQSDSVWIAYKSQFRNNLRELNELYCLSDPDFYPGKFKLNSADNFQTEYEKLNSALFPILTEKAEDFYLFLESLSTTEKHNFIRYFSFHENNIESFINSAGLPDEIKYVVPAISAMNPKSVTVDGKAGMCQLTHFQAVLNGLSVNNLVDERLNEHKSSEAFAEVMKQNTVVFKTPELAVLGYILGNAKVQNAISLADKNPSLKEVLIYLPESASNFIAAFQATLVFLNANAFKSTIEPLAIKVFPDTVRITRQMHFRQVCEVLNISEKELQFLNPQFIFKIVPGNERTEKLALPHGKWDDFVLWQDSIYKNYDSTLFQFTVQKIEYPPAPNRQYLGEPVKNLVIEGKTKIQYRLKTGDVLGIIAEDFDVDVADLKYWNNISNERKIQAGKNLDIFVDDDKADFYRKLSGQQNTETKKEIPQLAEQFQQNSTLKVFEDLKALPTVEHIVKNGESPFTIAKKYKDVSPDEILFWNNINDARKIQIGQKLKIYLKR